jgi:hypothetical protein
MPAATRTRTTAPAMNHAARLRRGEGMTLASVCGVVTRDCGDRSLITSVEALEGLGPCSEDSGRSERLRNGEAARSRQAVGLPRASQPASALPRS